MQKPDYYYQKKREYKDKLEELKQKLPGYVQPYLNDKELTIQISSVTAYAYDLVVFFECHLKQFLPELTHKVFLIYLLCTH